MPQTQIAHTYSVHTILALFQTCQINPDTSPSFPHFSLDKDYEEMERKDDYSLTCRQTSLLHNQIKKWAENSLYCKYLSTKISQAVRLHLMSTIWEMKRILPIFFMNCWAYWFNTGYCWTQQSIKAFTWDTLSSSKLHILSFTRLKRKILLDVVFQDFCAGLHPQSRSYCIRIDSQINYNILKLFQEHPGYEMDALL